MHIMGNFNLFYLTVCHFYPCLPLSWVILIYYDMNCKIVTIQRNEMGQIDLYDRVNSTEFVLSTNIFQH